MTEKLYGHREGWKERVEKVFFHYDSDSDLNLVIYIYIYINIYIYIYRQCQNFSTAVV